MRSWVLEMHYYGKSLTEKMTRSLNLPCGIFYPPSFALSSSNSACICEIVGMICHDESLEDVNCEHTSAMSPQVSNIIPNRFPGNTLLKCQSIFQITGSTYPSSTHFAAIKILYVRRRRAGRLRNQLHQMRWQPRLKNWQGRRVLQLPRP